MSTQELILILETSSRIGSVALAQGPEILAQTNFTAPMRHSAEIFGAITELMQRFDRKPEQITDIYISIGPGSFTGLRIAVAIAKAMYLANNLRIVTVDTLDVIAQNAPCDPQPANFRRIAPILDAKRNQFYVAAYRQPDATTSQTTTWQRLIPDSLMTAPEFLEQFADSTEPIALLGDGLLYHENKFQSEGTIVLDEKYWSPQAEKVHALGYQLALAGKFADPLTLTPTYIRRPEAEEKWQQH
ncbi:MAG: tRNA (adenosine(37)-N6)-threonylcarbamoyltransferase complex dimerization subunit type 1 TsaB [Planctomycetota bacterium]|jgi:tRNA threonylcarbamoyladenosine biosynthesis protein TsaB